MNKIKYCKKCVLNEYYSGIVFNEDGICNHCENHSLSKPDTQLLDDRVLYEIGENNNTYDLLVAYSGGKDSTYILHQLITKYKLKVLALTLDNHFLSETAFQNIDAASRILGFDHISFKFGFDCTRSVFSQSIALCRNNQLQDMFKTFGILCWPCFMFLTVALFNTATAFNIRYIAGGFSFGQIQNLKPYLDDKHRGFLSGKLVSDFFVMPLYNQLHMEDLHPQFELFENNHAKDDLLVIPYFLFEPYNEKKIIKSISNDLDWVRPDDTDGCSTNCLLNSYSNQLFQEIFHYNRYAEQLSRQIRINEVSRNEALQAINNPGSQEIIDCIKKRLTE